MKEIVLVSLIILTLWGCKSKKTTNLSDTKTDKIQANKPFSYSEATYQYSYGGREGVKGAKIEIKGIKPIDDLVFTTVYFNNKKGKIFTTTKDFISIKGSIDLSDPRPQRAHVEPIEEYGNSAPVKPKYPHLKDNEAVIKYSIKGEEFHWQVTLIKKEPLFYP
ncbi:MAG: hypothetical protein V3U80_01005 [Flavobacteriaceae bacterium]